jgi:hypothetical protein
LDSSHSACGSPPSIVIVFSVNGYQRHVYLLIYASLSSTI